MTDTDYLNARATALQTHLRQRAEAAQKAAVDTNADLNRLALAQILLDADLPEGAVVDIYDWAEEPNGDGTYDMDVSEAYLPDGGEVFGDLAGQGAVPAGRVDGGTDWDVFLVEDTPECNRIAVAKVYAWLRDEHV